MIKEAVSVPDFFHEVHAQFDAVLMLTWSNWRTEPRSNRYHYATRFARHMPVYFVQPIAQVGAPLLCESSEVPGVELVETGRDLTAREADELLQLLRDRGIARPLVWIYNPIDFQQVLVRLTANFRVFHATEDYFTASDSLRVWRIDQIREALRALLPEVDLLVSVSQGVQASISRVMGLPPRHLIAPNGCDAAFYARFVGKAAFSRHEWCRQRAVYQGAINDRIDFELLQSIAMAMPDWDFIFCGAAVDSADWQALRRLKNVNYMGSLAPERVAAEMVNSDVGLVPFKQDAWIRNSLPLKAYEYVACGLPVVSVPIDALQAQPDLFAIANDGASFVARIREAVSTRFLPTALEMRQQAARVNSYDARFERIWAEIGAGVKQRRGLRRTVAVLGGNSVEARSSWGDLLRMQLSMDVFFLRPPASTGRLDASQADDDTLDFFDMVLIGAPDVSQWTVPGTPAQRWLNRFSGVRVLVVEGLTSDREAILSTTRDLRRMKAYRPDFIFCVAAVEDGVLPPSWSFVPARIVRTQALGHNPPDATHAFRWACELLNLPVLPRSRYPWFVSLCQMTANGQLRTVLPLGGLAGMMGSYTVSASQGAFDTGAESKSGIGQEGRKTPPTKLSVKYSLPLRVVVRSTLWRLLRWVKSSDVLTLLALNVWSRLPGFARAVILKSMQRR
jgi:glycosyltransferase involved in cell wall biosynthesis